MTKVPFSSLCNYQAPTQIKIHQLPIMTVLKQSTLSSVHNPYKIIRNQNSVTVSPATATTRATTTTTTTASINNATTEEDNMGTAHKYNHMRGKTTNAGYRNAIRLYDLYKEKNRDLACQYPSLDDLRPPVSRNDHVEFKQIITGFAEYLIVDARMIGTDKLYDAGSGKTIFLNLIGYLKSVPEFATYKEPDWYKGTGTNIKNSLLKIHAENGKLKTLKKETRVGRKVFKDMLEEVFRQCPQHIRRNTCDHRWNKHGCRHMSVCCLRAAC